MQTKVISVTQVNNTHTVVLQQCAHTVTVEGVIFVSGAENGVKRVDVRNCTQATLTALFNNWVYEGIMGEGRTNETITLTNCKSFTCKNFTVMQSACGKVTWVSNTDPGLMLLQDVLQYVVNIANGGTRLYTYSA